MMHAKFQDNRTVLRKKVFEGFFTYGRGGHLGHVTWTIYINFPPSQGGSK